MTETVMRNAAELGPLAEGADRRFATSRKDTAGAETDDVGELGGQEGRGSGGRIHAPGVVSTARLAGTKSPRWMGAGFVAARYLPPLVGGLPEIVAFSPVIIDDADPGRTMRGAMVMGRF